MFNVDLLRPYHAPLLEHNDLHKSEPEYIHLDVQEPILCDTIVGRRICLTRMNSIPFFKVDKDGQLPAQGKWYYANEVADKFTHLNEYIMETIIS